MPRLRPGPPRAARGRRAALVELSGRVQEARAVAERRGGAGGVPDRGAEMIYRAVEALGRLHVAHDRHVVRRLGGLEQLPESLVGGVRLVGELAVAPVLLEDLRGVVL